LEATGKIHVIAAVKGDKALAEMVEGIGGFADTLRFPVVATDMPMIDPAVLRAAFGRGTTTASVAAALTEAQAGSGPADLIVVCGSLYLVGAARAQLFGQRGWALDAVSDK
jgi:folylpolyglutamate synthase/dihydropteroate synthase